MFSVRATNYPSLVAIGRCRSLHGNLGNSVICNRNRRRSLDATEQRFIGMLRGVAAHFCNTGRAFDPSARSPLLDACSSEGSAEYFQPGNAGIELRTWCRDQCATDQLPQSKCGVAKRYARLRARVRFARHDANGRPANRSRLQLRGVEQTEIRRCFRNLSFFLHGKSFDD